MIVRDNRTPRGRYEEQPRSPFTLAEGLSALLDEPYSWRDSDEVFARREAERETKRRERVVVATTVRPTLQVVCRGPNCTVVFTTENPRRVYCSTSCMNRAWRQQKWAKEHEGQPMVAKSRKKGVTASCHTDRPHVAFGLCRPCYNAHWARRQQRLSA